MPIEPVELSYSAAFLRQLKRLSKKYRSIRADLQPILDRLQSGETPGDQIQGTGCAVYKVRAANRDAARGTSGGYRMIYCIQSDVSLVLLAIYSKSEQSDMTVEQIQGILDSEVPG